MLTYSEGKRESKKGKEGGRKERKRKCMGVCFITPNQTLGDKLVRQALYYMP